MITQRYRNRIEIEGYYSIKVSFEMKTMVNTQYLEKKKYEFEAFYR